MPVLSSQPQEMSYQAVIRNASGELVTDRTIGMQFSILQGSAEGTAVFVEQHTPVTNSFGLIMVQIGSGTLVSGSLGDIDWAAGPYFLKTETDPAGGTSYTISGTSQMLSVPYALYAGSAKKAATLTIPYAESVSQPNYVFSLVNSDASVMKLASTATTGVTYALNAQTNSVESSTVAVRGASVTSHSPGTTYGVFGVSDSQSGCGVAGTASSTTGTNKGVLGHSYSEEGRGVYGIGGAETGFNIGVYGVTNSTAGTGVHGTAFNSTGVTYGVKGNVISSDGYSGFFEGGKFYVSDRMGIGTKNPSTMLEVAGQVKIAGGNPAQGKVLTSDDTGLASWEPVPVPPVNQICFEVILDESYSWPTNGHTYPIDFSSRSTVSVNHGNAFDLTTNTFTVPEDGVYSFCGTVFYEHIAAGDEIRAGLLAGNKTYYGGWTRATNSFEAVTFAMTLYLTEGQTVQMLGYVSEATPPATIHGYHSEDSYFTFFSGAKVR